MLPNLNMVAKTAKTCGFCPQKGMGDGMQFSALRVDGPAKLWVIRGYVLSKVWVMRGSTGFLKQT